MGKKERGEGLGIQEGGPQKRWRKVDKHLGVKRVIQANAREKEKGNIFHAMKKGDRRREVGN